jgi:hypothetical protein
MSRYKVTQRSDRRGVTNSKVYKSLLWARFIAWLFEGKGFNGDHYSTWVEEVDR